MGLLHPDIWKDLGGKLLFAIEISEGVWLIEAQKSSKNIQWVGQMSLVQLRKEEIIDPEIKSFMTNGGEDTSGMQASLFTRRVMLLLHCEITIWTTLGMT